MTLTNPHRTTIRRRLRPVIDDDEALDELMAQFPATDETQPVTEAAFRVGMADLRTEIRDASIRTIAILLPAMIASNGITVALVAALTQR